MTEEIEQLLRNLRLRRMADIYDDELRRADQQQIPYSEFLAQLLRAQWQDSLTATIGRRIKRAGMPEDWPLETFPFSRQKGVRRRQIKTFAELDFLSRAENIVFIGPTGVGKTGLACGILLKALQNGYRGRFVRAQDLFDEMYASLADRSSRKLVNQLARLDLLVVDELGFVNIRPEQANIFFRLMQERYNRRATIITTNLHYDDWAAFLGNPLMTEALLSRLRHRCHTLTIDGPSLRVPQQP